MNQWPHFSFPTKQLRKITKSFSGGTPSTDNFEYWEGDIPWASAKDLKEFYLEDTEDHISAKAVAESSTKIVPTHSVLVVVRSGILVHTFPVAVNRNQIAINQDLKALVCKKDVLAPYLAYFLLLFNRHVLLRAVKHSTTVQSVNTFEFDRLEIPVPNLAFQAKIIDLLDAAQTERSARHKRAAAVVVSIDRLVLEALGIELPEKDDGTLANRIFYTKSGRLTAGRFDPDALHSERLNTLEAVGASRFPVEPLYRAVKFVRKVTSDLDTGLPYVGLVDIESSTGIYRPSGEVEEFGSANIFSRGNVLFPKLRPYLNKVFLAPFDGLCSTEFHVLDGKLIANRFLAAFLRTSVVVSQTKRLMTGNTLPRLQTGDIESLLIPIPPIEIQNEIADQVDKIFAEVKCLREEGDMILAKAKAEVERMILGEV